jgi:hypothetical protein
MGRTKLCVVAGALLTALGCGEKLDHRPPSTGLPIAMLAYADDGTLVVGARDRFVRLNPALNEIDRTTPPYPFDTTKQQGGLTFFGVSRDGAVGSLGWQDNSDQASPATLSAGGIVFALGTGQLLRGDTYAFSGSAFQGQFLAPDGQTTATFAGGATQVAPVAGTADGGGAAWHAPTWMAPQFTADSSALLVGTSSDAGTPAIRVLQASGGAILTRSLALPPLAFGEVLTAVSADNNTLAVFLLSTPQTGMVVTFRLPDGTPLLTIPVPADLSTAWPTALAINTDGSQIALSYVPGGPDAMLVWKDGLLAYRRDGETDFALAFSLDGATLATGSNNGDVRLLNAGDGTLLARQTVAAAP